MLRPPAALADMPLQMRAFLHLPVAAAILTMTVACASGTRAKPQPFPLPHPSERVPTAPDPPSPAAAPKEASEVVRAALNLTGVSYRQGGTTPDGFDCSGFVQYVFSQARIALPRNVAAQFDTGSAIDVGEIAPGDLLFFSTTAPGPTHVAIAIGNEDFIHAPSSRGHVRVESLRSRYWASRLVGVRRVAAMDTLEESTPSPGRRRERYRATAS